MLRQGRNVGRPPPQRELPQCITTEAGRCEAKPSPAGRGAGDAERGFAGDGPGAQGARCQATPTLLTLGVLVLPVPPSCALVCVSIVSPGGVALAFPFPI
eukprot:7951485-Pyramimonas_sp.AAC.1